jgi:hypothetical protein
VEHVTKQQAFIKAGTWDSNGKVFDFKPTSFDFMIAGPLGLYKVPPFNQLYAARKKRSLSKIITLYKFTR